MTSTPLQCLFCQHLNPADASFCNNCASQLNLKPCAQCSAVDNQSATHCYKCGAAFTLLKAAQHPALLDKELTPTLRYPAYVPQALTALIATQSQRAATGTRRTWGVAVSALVLAAFALLIYNLMGLSKPPARLSAMPQPQSAVTATTASRPKETPRAEGNEKNTVRALAPPVAEMVTTQRLPTTPMAKVQPRLAAPEFKECPPAVAALGLCNPGKPQE